MVIILMGNGFEEAEALVPADLLRRVGVEVALAGVNGMQINGAHDIKVLADCTIDQVDREKVDLVVLPGGLGGVESIGACPAAVDLIRWQWDRGGRVAAICAAPTLLAKLGITEGRKAVCYPGMEDKLIGAEHCPGHQVVEDGNLITGEGPGAAYAFGLKLVEVLKGAETAKQLAHAACCRV